MATFEMNEKRKNRTSPPERGATSTGRGTKRSVGVHVGSGVAVAIAAAVLLAMATGVVGLAEGVDAGSFVRNGIGARAFGLGGAFVSIADDFSTPLWNPAGVAQLSGVNLGGMYTNKFDLGIDFQSLGAAARFGAFGVGASMVRSTIDEIPLTGESTSGVFSDTQSLYVGTLAYDLSGRLGKDSGALSSLLIGANVKVYSEAMLDASATGVGGDLGLLATLSFKWGTFSLGASALDIGGTALQWTGTDHNPVNNVPWINRLGGSLCLLDQRLTLACAGDLAIGQSSLDELHVGAEYWPVKELALRAGVTLGADGSVEPAAGASVNWHGVQIDYAFIPQQALGDSHVLSVAFQFAPPKKAPAATKTQAQSKSS